MGFRVFPSVHAADINAKTQGKFNGKNTRVTEAIPEERLPAPCKLQKQVDLLGISRADNHLQAPCFPGIALTVTAQLLNLTLFLEPGDRWRHKRQRGKQDNRRSHNAGAGWCIKLYRTENASKHRDHTDGRRHSSHRLRRACQLAGSGGGNDQHGSNQQNADDANGDCHHNCHQEPPATGARGECSHFPLWPGPRELSSA